MGQGQLRAQPWILDVLAGTTLLVVVVRLLGPCFW